MTHPEACAQAVVDHVASGTLERSRQRCIALQLCSPLCVLFLPLALLTKLLERIECRALDSSWCLL